MTAFVAGEVIAERTVQLDRESLVRYAAASGDFNAIHYRDDVASAMGLPGVLAHGMLTMGIASSVATAALPDPAAVTDFAVRFTKPVLVDAETGASLQIVATVGTVDETSARIDLTVTCGQDTVLGKAQLRVALG